MIQKVKEIIEYNKKIDKGIKENKICKRLDLILILMCSSITSFVVTFMALLKTAEVSTSAEHFDYIYVAGVTYYGIVGILFMVIVYLSLRVGVYRLGYRNKFVKKITN